MKQCIGILLGILAFWAFHMTAEVFAAPEVSAQAAVVMEAGTFDVLFEKNAYEKRPMASTTKIMTTLLTLESGDLDEVFPVDSDAIHVEGSSMGLVEGDLVTKRALCCGMLLPSGNDAANAAAVAVAGSIPAFVKQMNDRAAQIGMTHTCFVTPSGLDGEGHGASAYDMALLTREALRNADFRAICCQKSTKVSFGNPPYDRTLYNSNKLLGMYEGVIGVKTGFTDDAGRCLVSACERDGVTLICVTLHAPDDWNDHIRLYDAAFAQVEARTLAVPEGLTMPVAGGSAEQVGLRAAYPLTIGWRCGQTPDVSAKVQRVPLVCAPVQAGETLGMLVYYRKGRIIGEIPLCADRAVPARTRRQGFREWLQRALP